MYKVCIIYKKLNCTDVVSYCNTPQEARAKLRLYSEIPQEVIILDKSGERLGRRTPSFN